MQILTAIVMLMGQAAAPPPGTDIWLARLTSSGAIGQPMNITARPGYDNQPSFTPDGKGLLFTSRREDAQTDIYFYDFTSRSSQSTRLTHTPESEYSPTVTPDGTGISVIRVEADGTQRLWRFTRDGTNPALVLANVKPVGYHAWGPDGALALFVLGTPNTLQVADSAGRSQVITQRIGRSMHRIPGRDTISVLHIDVKEGLGSPKPGEGGPVAPKPGEGGRWIKELNLKTRALTPIVRALETQDGDYVWTPDGAILMSDGKSLFRWKGQEGPDWKSVSDLAARGLRGVTRMAVSPDGKWIALVAPDGSN